MSVTRSDFGTLENGEQIYKYQIDSKSGQVKAVVTNYGAFLISVETKNRAGDFEEICLSHKDDLATLSSQTGRRYFGCIAGRVANRIRHGKFNLDGKDYTLAVNNGVHHLHGGIRGFDTKVWTVSELSEGRVGVCLEYFSPDMEEGYPGNLKVKVIYELLSAEDSLQITYEATTDQATIVNLTNHTYWNLSGNWQRTVQSQRLQLACSHYLPVDNTQIPTGDYVAVKDTPFDLTKEGGVQLEEVLPLVDGCGRAGLDHCFIVDTALDPDTGCYLYNAQEQANGVKNYLRPVAIVVDEISGRKMALHATQPGVQVYTANWLSLEAKDHPFVQYNGLCLETQHFPDSVNQGKFPTVVLRPEQLYHHQAKFTSARLFSHVKYDYKPLDHY